MNRKRTIIFSACLILFLGVITILYFTSTNKEEPVLQTTSEKLPTRTTTNLSTAITQQSTNLANDGKPVFTIDNVARPQDGWYVVTMYLQSDIEKTNPAKILLQDMGGKEGLRVIIGPGTAFPPEETQAYNIPGPVATELNK